MACKRGTNRRRVGFDDLVRSVPTNIVVRRYKTSTYPFECNQCRYTSRTATANHVVSNLQPQGQNSRMNLLGCSSNGRPSGNTVQMSKDRNIFIFLLLCLCWCWRRSTRTARIFQPAGCWYWSVSASLLKSSGCLDRPSLCSSLLSTSSGI